MNSIQSLAPQSPEISVATPINPALERVKQILFQPFDLGKWFVIGFCAWLAFLGQTGGAGFNFHVPGGGQRGGGNVQQEFERVRHYVIENLHWLVPLVVGVILIAIAISFLVAWLSSRGRFMFLHCVALNRAEVAEPWGRFAAQGNSLFWFRIVLGLIGFVVSLPILAVGGVLLYRMIASQTWTAPGIAVLVGLGLVFIFIAIVFAIVNKLTMDFVVPLMYLRAIGCLSAWRELRALLGANPGRFTLYLLFQIVLGMIIGFLVLVFMVFTCCFCCLMLLPYVGTVVLLPVLVFKQSYPLYYLAQYGREFDVFASAGPAMSAGQT